MSKDRRSEKSTRKKASRLPAFDFGKDLLKGKAPEEEAGAAVETPGPAVPVLAREGLLADDPPTEEIVVNEPSDSAYESAPVKIELPAFGFAEDLLREYRAKQAAAAAASSSGAESTAVPMAATPMAATPAEAPTEASPEPIADLGKTMSTGKVMESAEDRIFAFADSLDARAGKEEKVRPKRMATWLTLVLADELFALPVEPVRQVLRLSSITRVPHAPRPIRGVTNVRGRVIPVVDLRLRLELPESELDRGSRIIVVHSRGRLLGLLVDAVKQVVHLDMDLVQPPPDDVMTIQSDYISGVYDWQDRLLLLIDVERALILRGLADADFAAGRTPARASFEQTTGWES